MVKQKNLFGKELSQSVVPALVQEGVLEENFLNPVVCPLLSFEVLEEAGAVRGGFMTEQVSLLGVAKMLRFVPSLWKSLSLETRVF